MGPHASFCGTESLAQRPTSQRYMDGAVRSGADVDVRVAAVLEVAWSRLGVTHSTASRLVTRAVVAGMVARNRSPSDPRRAALALTGAGGRPVAASREFRTGYLDGLLADWSTADVATLADSLDRFATAVSATKPQPLSRDGVRPGDPAA